MSVNKYQKHLLVLPEDDANRQMANGFQLDASVNARRIQVLEVAGGWEKVVESFVEVHVPELIRFSLRFLVLLVDFDERQDRLSKIRASIPEELRDRVFVLGAWSEPEKLKQDLGPYETIGAAMARDCHDNSDKTWSHGLLRHNAVELEGLRKSVRPFLFE